MILQRFHLSHFFQNQHLLLPSQFLYLHLLYLDKKDYYEIIAGERRWRAAKLAGLKEVPVRIMNLTDQEVVEISLVENIQRENLNPIEEAFAYKRLLTEFHLLLPSQFLYLHLLYLESMNQFPVPDHVFLLPYFYTFFLSITSFANMR